MPHFRRPSGLSLPAFSFGAVFLPVREMDVPASVAIWANCRRTAEPTSVALFLVCPWRLVLAPICIEFLPRSIWQFVYQPVALCEQMDVRRPLIYLRVCVVIKLRRVFILGRGMFMRTWLINIQNIQSAYNSSFSKYVVDLRSGKAPRNFQQPRSTTRSFLVLMGTTFINRTTVIVVACYNEFHFFKLISLNTKIQF